MVRASPYFTHDAVRDIPSLPRQEVDPTGAGDVFAAAFLVPYHEMGDPGGAGVRGLRRLLRRRGIGTATLGDRAEVAPSPHGAGASA